MGQILNQILYHLLRFAEMTAWCIQGDESWQFFELKDRETGERTTNYEFVSQYIEIYSDSGVEAACIYLLGDVSNSVCTLDLLP
jgi:hypothetical protein